VSSAYFVAPCSNHEQGWPAPYTYAVYRVGQNRISALYMAVCMVIPLPKTPYIHRKYLNMNISGQP